MVVVIFKTTLGTILDPITSREEKHFKVELLPFLALNNKLHGGNSRVAFGINSCVARCLNSGDNTPVVPVPYDNE